MADEQQVALIKQGRRAWNDWRERTESIRVDLTGAHLTDADLAGADLLGAHLAGAHLSGADLSGANLFHVDLTDADLTNAGLSGANLHSARLMGAHLTGADLSGADLTDADLTRADLTDANLLQANLVSADLPGAHLTGADLREANLARARLAGADLTRARCSKTVLADLDLSQALGLESIIHEGPSVINHRTLELSGPLHISFLQGCGLPDRLIDYLPSLLSASPIEFYSVFISYSTANQNFADRLHKDLQKRGVRCWFAPHNMEGGKKVHDQIDAAIRVHDRLLLILSRESMSSRWVKTEIETAREKEVRENRDVLFPIALVPFSDIREWRQFNADLGDDNARRVREFFVPDFSGWEVDDGSYPKTFDQLVAALKSADERLRLEGGGDRQRDGRGMRSEAR